MFYNCKLKQKGCISHKRNETHIEKTAYSYLSRLLAFFELIYNLIKYILYSVYYGFDKTVLYIRCYTLQLRFYTVEFNLFSNLGV